MLAVTLTWINSTSDGLWSTAANWNTGLRPLHGLKGSKTGRFTCASDRLARWTADPDIILHGYWFWDWAESQEAVKSIHAERREIELEPPVHTYGYRGPVTDAPGTSSGISSRLAREATWPATSNSRCRATRLAKTSGSSR